MQAKVIWAICFFSENRQRWQRIYHCSRLIKFYKRIRLYKHTNYGMWAFDKILWLDFVIETILHRLLVNNSSMRQQRSQSWCKSEVNLRSLTNSIFILWYWKTSCQTPSQGISFCKVNRNPKTQTCHDPRL